MAAVAVVFSVSAQEDCATALTVPGSGTSLPAWTFIGDNTGSIDDYEEDSGEGFNQTGGTDHVWIFTPDSTKYYDISLCQGTTDHDTKLYVYEGSCPTGGPVATGTQIAISDDACDNAPLFVNPWVSRIENVELTAGTTYYIVKDGWGPGDEGNYTGLITDAANPPSGFDVAIGEGRYYNESWIPWYNTFASTFACVVVNNGSTPASNVVVTAQVFSDADGFAAPVFSDASAPISMAGGTVEVVTGVTPYEPAENGTYIIQFDVSYDGTDDVDTNETSFAFLVVTDSFQERSYAFINGFIDGATRLATVDPTAEYGVLQTYGVDAAATGAIVLVSYDPTNPAGTSEPITANLYQLVPDATGALSVDSDSLIATGSVPVDTGALVYEVPFNNTVPISAGFYTLAYNGQNFVGQTDFIYSNGSSDLVRGAVTGGAWGFFTGPYAWTNTLITTTDSCTFATAPRNQSHLDNTPPGRVTLNWDPLDNSTACQVGGSRISAGPGPASGSQQIVGSEPEATVVPYSLLPAGSQWTWRVRCACGTPPSIATASPYTAFGDTFTVPTLRQSVEADIALDMFPNPASEQLTVSFDAAGGDVSFTVTNLMGQTVIARTETMFEGFNSINFDVTGLEPGAYFLTIEEGENRLSEEFTVIR